MEILSHSCINIFINNFIFNVIFTMFSIIMKIFWINILFMWILTIFNYWIIIIDSFFHYKYFLAKQHGPTDDKKDKKSKNLNIAAILTVMDESSYDSFFRPVKQNTKHINRIAVYSCDKDSIENLISQLKEYNEKEFSPPRDDLKLPIDDFDGMDDSSYVAMNYECHSGCIESGFHPRNNLHEADYAAYVSPNICNMKNKNRNKSKNKNNATPGSNDRNTNNRRDKDTKNKKKKGSETQTESNLNQMKELEFFSIHGCLIMHSDFSLIPSICSWIEIKDESDKDSRAKELRNTIIIGSPGDIELNSNKKLATNSTTKHYIHVMSLVERNSSATSISSSSSINTSRSDMAIMSRVGMANISAKSHDMAAQAASPASDSTEHFGMVNKHSSCFERNNELPPAFANHTLRIKREDYDGAFLQPAIQPSQIEAARHSNSSSRGFDFGFGGYVGYDNGVCDDGDGGISGVPFAQSKYKMKPEGTILPIKGEEEYVVYDVRICTYSNFGYFVVVVTL